MKKLLFLCLLFLATKLQAQGPNPRPLTMAEFQKAKTFTIKDLDNDTYVKFENMYILDRYEAKKPYFITGSDGLKKRIDLYKLIAKENLQELGTMIFYTNEKSKQYQVLLPNLTADGKVWEQYFDDVDNIDKVEKNFALKLSYVLSKEFSFQQFKAMNGGKDMKDEHATYGNDICFPGDQVVSLADGSSKLVKDIQVGDAVVSIDETTKTTSTIKVTELVSHEEKNYALTQLLLVSAKERDIPQGIEILLSAKTLKATPNHPMVTETGGKKMGEISQGDKVLCLNPETQLYEPFTVLLKTESGEGVQKVYSINSDSGTTLLMNGVMVRQK